ncbi:MULTISPECIES: Maf family protein [unclassified Collinsella]|uniref:Maf family protein n=1 Tax=unclassified Collinsella TaxID=2637548 RepID=UPI00319E2559
MSLFDLPSRIDRLVLASGSPRRVELLREMGFDPVVRPQDIDEAAALKAFANSFDEELGEDFGEEPTCEEMVRHLAECKAMSALREETKPGDVILAADTIVAIDGEELGKPHSEEDAIEMLHALSGRTHEVSTGVCLLSPTRTGGHRSFSFYETTSVTFYELDDATIETYVKTGEPLDKAGAYGIQGLGRTLVRTIEGDYFNVVGLPVAKTMRALEAFVGKSD